MPEKLTENIYRVCIPFEDIYTTAFVLVEGEHCLVYDSGNSPTDAERYVLPALERMGRIPEVLLYSHSHGDHSGGMRVLSEAFPKATVGSFSDKRYSVNNLTRFEDGDVLFGRFQLVNLKGHTEDGLAVLDTVDQILVTGDCLQLDGVGRYGTGVSDGEGYFRTLDRVRAMGLQGIFASHDYRPLGFAARGQAEVARYLDECEAIYRRKMANKNK